MNEGRRTAGEWKFRREDYKKNQTDGPAADGTIL